MHGGPPSGLLARAIESFRTDADDGPPFVARITIELLRRVTLHPVRIDTELLRPGRKIQLVQAILRGGPDGETELARAVGLRMQRQQMDLPASALALTADDDALARPPAGPEAGIPTPAMREEQGFFELAADKRMVRGTAGGPGHGTMWARLRQPLVEGEEPTPFVRTATLADFGNAVGMILPTPRFAYPNADLTIALHREPRGEWICIDGITRVGPEGIGLAVRTLHDLDGVVGATTQSLVITDLGEGA